MSIREIETQDAATVNHLSHQLGYNISLSETATQIKEVIESMDNCAFVALYEGKIIGWIHAFKTTRLETKTFVEIGGLIVDENFRGKGVGKILVNKIKDWCIEQKITSLRVRSNTKRLEAHNFYLNLGFSESKQQKVFESKL